MCRHLNTQHVANYYILYIYICNSNFDFPKAVNRLRPTKSVALDDICALLLRAIPVPVLKYIFILSLSQQHIPTQWKHSEFVPAYKKSNATCVQNHRTLSLLNIFRNYLNVLWPGVA
jgi:hypothetical protein